MCEALSVTDPDRDVTIRRAVPADIPAVLDFWSRVGENGSRPPDRPDLLERLLLHDPDAVLVAETDDRILATIVCGWDGWRANLYRLAVAPELRGRGVARRLLHLVEERLRGLGAERFCAMVLDDNELGTAWWRSVGYKPQTEWSRWVKDA